MKNRRNIVEQKYPPENPNDIWLKDGKFYHSTSEGWTIIDSEIEYTSKTSMIADKPKGGTIGINKETGEASIYNDVAKQWSPLGGGVTAITWQELKDKRDNGQLIPGSLYRIIDYNCTTTQENTQSAGHQFDIVLLALSENKLAEEGWAMMHDNIYDVTFLDGVTKKCWIYYREDDLFNIIDVNTLIGVVQDIGAILSVNETTKTIEVECESTTMEVEGLQYNYFQNSNLSAWKVWYCLDNDTSRFAWADDSVDEGTPASITYNSKKGEVEGIRNSTLDGEYNGTMYYGWTEEGAGIRYTTSETPSIGDTIYNGSHQTFQTVLTFTPAHEGTGLPNGRGVIYRLIDEFNNDIKYDFKNIQFKRTITDGQYDVNGTETWCYTLNVWYNNYCNDASIVGNTLLNDEGFVTGVCDNNFGYATAYNLLIEGVDTFAFALGNNVVLSLTDGDGYYYGIYSNMFGDNFFNNTFGNIFSQNTFGSGCRANTLGDDFSFNTIGNDFKNNRISNNFYYNTIGNSFGYNTIENDFYFNMIGNAFQEKQISTVLSYANYGNNGVELATKNDLN